MLTQFLSVLWAKSGLSHRLLQYPGMEISVSESARMHRVSVLTVASNSKERIQLKRNVVR
jgi:predicted transcriptional regulator